MEEKEVKGYRERVIGATRKVLVEVFKILEDFHESLILIGGWVPIMIFPESEDKYVGTIDVDLVINDQSLNETGSKTIDEILLTNNYEHGTEPGRYFKTIDTYIELS